MNEKTMVNDILENVKSDLSAYQKAIAECSNSQLRQTFQQIRNSDECFQYELYKVAETKGYYKPANGCYKCSFILGCLQDRKRSARRICEW